MNRYWDVDEQKRAVLTREQVQAFLDVELMEKGIVKVEPPELQPIEPVKLEKTTYYEIQRKGEYGPSETSLLFTSAEKAQAFIELSPLWQGTKHEYGYKNHFAMPGCELSIKSVELPTEAAMSNAASILKRNTATEEANQKLSREYRTAVEATEKATQGIWTDWYECRDKQATLKRVTDTFAEYTELCNGDKAMAHTFLLKAFKEEQVKAAFEWFEIEYEPVAVEV
jgi:hypothetical protein